MGNLNSGQILSQVADAGVGTKTIVATFERTGATPSASAREAGIVFKDGNNPTIMGGITGMRNNSSGNFISGLKFYVNSTVGTPATSFLDLSLALTLDSSGAATFASSITTPSYVQSGVNIAINSSTATTLALVDCAMLLIRDASNGGSCICFFEIGSVSILSQSGATTFTTSAPSANQIQLAVGGGARSVTALGGSNRNGTQVRIGVFRNDGQ
jgi:hypothetical protein